MDDRPTCQPELQSNASWTRASRNFNIYKESAFRQSNRVLDRVLKRKRPRAMRKLLSTKDYTPMLDEDCMGEAIETYFADLHACNRDQPCPETNVMHVSGHRSFLIATAAWI